MERQRTPYTPETDDVGRFAFRGGHIESDLHHVVFPRKMYEIYPQGKAIRNAILVRDMWRADHENLHRNVSPLPVLGYYALQRVARDMDSYYADPLEGIDDFCYAVENSNRHRNCKPMERKLGELAIETIREQIPYIRSKR